MTKLEAKIVGINPLWISALLTAAFLIVCATGGDNVNWGYLGFEVIFPFYTAIAVGEWCRIRADQMFDVISAQGKSIFLWIVRRFLLLFVTVTIFAVIGILGTVIITKTASVGELLLIFLPTAFFLSSVCIVLSLLSSVPHIPTMAAGVIWLFSIMSMSLLRFRPMQYFYLFIRFADSGITVGLSGSKKSLKEQAAAFVDKVAGDVEFIQRTQPDDADEILLEYRSSLSVTYSVDKVLRRKQALMQQRRQREEQQAAMQAEAQAAQKVQEITEPHPPEMVAPPVEVQAPVVEEQAAEPTPPVQPQEQQENTQSIKLYRVSFDVIGSLEQLKELKKFLVSKNLLVNGGLNHEH